MYEEFLTNNIHQPKLFHNKSTKIIHSKRKSIIENQNKNRKCHSFDNKDQIEINLNISNNNNFPLSESISLISYSKEDNKNLNEPNSFNMKDNNYKNDSFSPQESPIIKKNSSSYLVKSSQKLVNLRKYFLNENKNEEEIKKDKKKMKRPNYLIKSCFYNNNDIDQRNYVRSLSKKESSPVMDFYIYQDKNDINNNDKILKKYYKHSTFGKAKDNKDILLKKDKNKLHNKKLYNYIKLEQNNNLSINKNNHNYFLNNEESFIKIIQADSSDDDNHEVKSFLEDKNDFANEIDIINKIKDKEDTLSNLINVSFKSQIIEKHNYLNESMNYKHNNSINYSPHNLSEGLSNSINSNRSLNEEFVFKNHSKIFQTKNNNLSHNNSINKNIEDKINNENNINKSDKQNILSHLKNDINYNQKYNFDYSEEELENRQFNNFINNNNLKIHDINNFKTANNYKSNQNEELNNLYLKQNNSLNNNIQNIYLNAFNNNYLNNNKNNYFNNNINNNYLQNLNSFKCGNNSPNPFINNTINFIYNNNMNLIYNNPYNNEYKNPKLNNNNNFLINNNINYNYYPNQFNNFIQTNNNPNIIPNQNNLNNINKMYYYQNNNNVNFNNMTQIKNIKENNNNFNNNKIIPKIKDYSKMSNEELAKQAHILAKSQDGSRFLEKIIDSNPTLASHLFFPYTLGYFEELSNNKYGNFYIKKLIKHLSKELLAKLLEFLSPMIAKIGTNQYGGKIMEQIIKSIKDDDNLLLSFIQEIIPHMILLINDLNGTHIIYKLLLL